jgi:hypothetical protein
MCYSKLLFLTLSLLISSSVFAADVSSNKSLEFKKYAFGGPFNMRMPFSNLPDRSVGDVIEEFRMMFHLPSEYKISIAIFLDGKMLRSDRLMSTVNWGEIGGGAFPIVVHNQHNQTPNFELLTDLIWVKHLGVKVMAFDKKPDRLIREMVKEYRNKRSVDPSLDVHFRVEKTQEPLMEDFLLSTYAIPHNRILVEYTSKKANTSATQGPAIQAVSTQWYEAKSKKTYFRDRFNKLEPLVGLQTSEYDGYLTFKKEKHYYYLRNDILRSMEERKISIVINGMLSGLTSESSEAYQSLIESEAYQSLIELVKPERILAIAALQKLCGKGTRKEFQPDEYNEKALRTLDPDKQYFINPFLRKVSPPGIDMTIYRFFDYMVCGLDEVPVVKDSPLYKILDAFDNSLTKIIEQKQ